MKIIFLFFVFALCHGLFKDTLIDLDIHTLNEYQKVMRKERILTEVNSNDLSLE